MNMLSNSGTEPKINLVKRLTDALTAIRARINGEWDNRALRAFGPLSSHAGTTEDILEISARALASADANQHSASLSNAANAEDDLELVQSALNSLDTVLLHNKAMSDFDLKARKTVLAEADDALVRLREGVEELHLRANFFASELQETAAELRDWDGTPEAMDAIRGNIQLALRGGSNGAYGSDAKDIRLANLRLIMGALDRIADGEDANEVIEQTGCTSVLSGMIQAIVASAPTNTGAMVLHMNTNIKVRLRGGNGGEVSAHASLDPRSFSDAVVRMAGLDDRSAGGAISGLATRLVFLQGRLDACDRVTRAEGEVPEWYREWLDDAILDVQANPELANVHIGRTGDGDDPTTLYVRSKGAADTEANRIRVPVSDGDVYALKADDFWNEDALCPCRPAARP